MPVILATVLGAVAGPAVGWLEQHRVPRIWGAILVLLGLVAIGVLIFCLVFGGISAQSGDISAKLNQAPWPPHSPPQPSTSATSYEPGATARREATRHQLRPADPVVSRVT